jgi:hypothetical protein
MAALSLAVLTAYPIFFTLLSVKAFTNGSAVSHLVRATRTPSSVLGMPDVGLTRKETP